MNYGLPALTLGGAPLELWLDAWRSCHHVEPVRTRRGQELRTRQWAWPDGRGYLEQDNLCVELFAVIGDQVVKAAARTS